MASATVERLTLSKKMQTRTIEPTWFKVACYYITALAREEDLEPVPARSRITSAAEDLGRERTHCLSMRILSPVPKRVRSLELLAESREACPHTKFVLSLQETDKSSTDLLQPNLHPPRLLLGLFLAQFKQLRHRSSSLRAKLVYSKCTQAGAHLNQPSQMPIHAILVNFTSHIVRFPGFCSSLSYIW